MCVLLARRPSLLGVSRLQLVVMPWVCPFPVFRWDFCTGVLCSSPWLGALRLARHVPLSGPQLPLLLTGKLATSLNDVFLPEDRELSLGRFADNSTSLHTMYCNPAVVCRWRKAVGSVYFPMWTASQSFQHHLVMRLSPHGLVTPPLITC